MENSNFNQHIILQPQNCLDSKAGSLLRQQLAEIVPDRQSQISNFPYTSSNRRANLNIINRLICQAIPMTDK